MTPEQQREWETDETQPSTFPARAATETGETGARVHGDADLLRKRTAALDRVAAENERLRAEVERLREDKATFERWRDQWILTTEERETVLARAEDRAEAAETKLRDVEALTKELERDADAHDKSGRRYFDRGQQAESIACAATATANRNAAVALRAVLARSQAPQAPAEQEGLACRHGRQLGPDDHGCARCREENLTLALDEQHMHEFEEDVDDGSMCVCGVPATEHWRVEPDIQAAIRDCHPAPSVLPATAGDEQAPEEPCPDCGGDPSDDTLHVDGCRRIFEKGDTREDLQFGPPWKPWREAQR